MDGLAHTLLYFASYHVLSQLPSTTSSTLRGASNGYLTAREENDQINRTRACVCGELSVTPISNDGHLWETNAHHVLFDTLERFLGRLLRALQNDFVVNLQNLTPAVRTQPLILLQLQHGLCTVTCNRDGDDSVCRQCTAPHFFSNKKT